MTTELICYDCLTDRDQKVPAVTTVRGTAKCERCAREHAEGQREMSRAVSEQNARLNEQFSQAGRARRMI